MLIATMGSCLQAGKRCDGVDGFCPIGYACVPSGEGRHLCLAPGHINKCGNEVIEDGEVCDDGNVQSGDGCSADCQSDEDCGNGIVDSARGETCDGGADDIAWLELNSMTDRDLRAAWGDGRTSFVVGEDGTIFRHTRSAPPR
ncbi:hypothetical protein WMF31_21850 [Sorangium sp. So ce1036]|uniref:hypothetical protein n=1 Tax=Sorangium sp. So ce1036 TaxID=3133328 RepID=UPI003F07A280